MQRERPRGAAMLAMKMGGGTINGRTQQPQEAGKDQQMSMGFDKSLNHVSNITVSYRIVSLP